MRVIHDEAQRTARHTGVTSLFSETPDSSSFGPIGFIAPVSASRLKGFIGSTGRRDAISPLVTKEDIEFLGQVVAEGIRRVNDSGGSLSRLSIRVVTKELDNGSFYHDLLAEIARQGAKLEATIPTAGGDIVYIGYNLPGRNANFTGGDEFKARTLIRNGSERLHEAARDIVANAQEYEVLPILEGNAARVFNAQQMKQIHTLLSAFNGDDSFASTETILNPNNVIGLVQQRSTEHIVGISVLEIRRIPLSNGDTMTLAELTDGRVIHPHGDRNLYARAVNEMFRTIAANHRDIDVVFAESNMGNTHLLEIAGMQGRQIGGVLSAHTEITDRETNRSELKNFMVTYLDLHDVGPTVANLDREVMLAKALRE